MGEKTKKENQSSENCQTGKSSKCHSTWIINMLQKLYFHYTPSEGPSNSHSAVGQNLQPGIWHRNKWYFGLAVVLWVKHHAVGKLNEHFVGCFCMYEECKSMSERGNIRLHYVWTTTTNKKWIIIYFITYLLSRYIKPKTAKKKNVRMKNFFTFNSSYHIQYVYILMSNFLLLPHFYFMWLRKRKIKL